ncbi:MAG: UDP-N-acetylmuramoyl-tripeptide--D-alanyl-D-alanine ligase [Clostridia bacterium]|nr:UDP-N-acetylmuramoyl-tripeptide--D-alanyl-D-alanine ligase [Clostridia bacterium]
MRIKLDIPISVYEIAAYLPSIKISAMKAGLIDHISTDTRELEKGDLFFALPGDNFNGEDFIAEAKRKGAHTVGTRLKNADYCVKNTLSALSSLANHYKNKLQIRTTVAITGSVGKTTTKDMTLGLLSKKYRAHGTYKNYNNEIGVPLTLLSAKKDTEILVIEAGMNHMGELEKLSRCIVPDISVITKIGSSHIGNLGSRENIAKAKAEIFLGMEKPYALIPYGEKLLDKYSFAKTVSADGSDADFSLSVKSTHPGKTVFDYNSKYNSLRSAEIKASSAHIPECLAFAISVASMLNMTNDELYSSVSTLELTEKSKVFKIGSLTILDDSYNSSYESVKMALKTLNLHKEKRKSAVIGDILELGNETERIHFELGKLAAGAGLSKLYVFGKNAEIVKAGAVKNGMTQDAVFVNVDTDYPETTANQIINNSSNETILFKASHNLKLERIIDILKVKLSEAN